MLPPPTTTTPESTKLLTGPMPNKEKKSGVDQGNLLRCTPCNLNFKTKKVWCHAFLTAVLIRRESAFFILYLVILIN
jgi:hypothetical protein